MPGKHGHKKKVQQAPPTRTPVGVGNTSLCYSLLAPCQSEWGRNSLAGWVWHTGSLSSTAVMCPKPELLMAAGGA